MEKSSDTTTNNPAGRLGELIVSTLGRTIQSLCRGDTANANDTGETHFAQLQGRVLAGNLADHSTLGHRVQNPLGDERPIL